MVDSKLLWVSCVSRPDAFQSPETHLCMVHARTPVRQSENAFRVAILAGHVQRGASTDLQDQNKPQEAAMADGKDCAAQKQRTRSVSRTSTTSVAAPRSSSARAQPTWPISQAASKGLRPSGCGRHTHTSICHITAMQGHVTPAQLTRCTHGGFVNVGTPVQQSMNALHVPINAGCVQRGGSNVLWGHETTSAGVSSRGATTSRRGFWPGKVPRRRGFGTASTKSVARTVALFTSAPRSNRA
jgi:hypothetical protein